METKSSTIHIHVGRTGNIGVIEDTLIEALDLHFPTVTCKDTVQSSSDRLTVIMNVEYDPAEYATDTAVREAVDTYASKPGNVELYLTETEYDEVDFLTH